MDKKERGTILKTLREEKKLRQADLADFLEISQQAYQRYENGTSEPNGDGFIKLADFYNVSTDYLLGRTNIKAMIGCSPEEQASATAEEVLKRYTAFPDDVRLLILNLIRKVIGLPEVPEDIRPVIVFTRCHRMKASAGMGYDLDNEDEWRDIRIYDCPEAHDADFAVEVDGDSMEPDYHDGDIVFVKLSEDVPVGRVGLFTHDGKGYIKERGEKYLISRNPDYPDIHGECRAVGVVIGKAEPAL